MRVKMLQDAPGSPDGVTVHEYDEGETYDVPADLAETFIKYDLAEAVDPAEPEPVEERVIIDEPRLGTGAKGSARANAKGSTRVMSAPSAKK